MNKDFDLKKDPSYGYSSLRSRIDATIKRMRDNAEELEVPQTKSMPIIPVTGTGSQEDKYSHNKSSDKF